MNRRQVLKASGIVATAGMSGLAGCTSSDTDGSDGTPTNGTTTTVLMVTEGDAYYFDPIGLLVESGDTVTFEIDSGSHSATAYEAGTGQSSVTRIPDGAAAFDSGILGDQGATFDHTFETTGTYDYYCTPHKGLGMVGRIVVGEPGGPAEGSMPPDGSVPESGTIVDQGAVTYGDFSG